MPLCKKPHENNQDAFSSPEDKEIVAFYTSCEGPNVFSDQLATAFIQGRAAQGVLDALEEDEFAAQCPAEVCLLLLHSGNFREGHNAVSCSRIVGGQLLGAVGLQALEAGDAEQGGRLRW